MRQINSQSLIPLPDQNQQELERLLAAYRQRLIVWADYAKTIRAQAGLATELKTNTSNGNPDQVSP